jgi:hypothetical protein
MFDGAATSLPFWGFFLKGMKGRANKREHGRKGK